MSRNIVFSKVIAVLWLSIIVLTQAELPPTFHVPKKLAREFNSSPQILSLASTDYGHIANITPWAVFEPRSVSDIKDLISYSYSLPKPFTIATRGQAHSVLGQAMTRDGVVLNMTNLKGYRKGLGIVVSSDGKSPLGYYADVGGEQRWIDVLNATLKHGLTPFSFADYLYLSVGGTLSNAGISGRSFRFGPQISNVLEVDVITGKGAPVTSSPKKNPEAFYAVLGGLGQFGVITRARIPLAPAPTRVHWLRIFYNDFKAFTRDQEHIISFNERNDSSAVDFLEGRLQLNQPPIDLSFYPTSDQPRIKSLITRYGILYILELVKYYDNTSQARVEQEVANLVKGLSFVPTFVFQKNASYLEFLNRIHDAELAAKAQGFWDIPHPWLNMFVPKSRILDFNEGVFKGILYKQNLTTGIALVYPMNRNKWDDRMSAVIPNEDVFYSINLFQSTVGLDQVKKYEAQNRQILQFCKNAGIQIKEYLTGNKTHQEWVEHFGPKWKLFEYRKAEFDPKKILSPGQGIFQ